jgi:hypothetical protein
VFSEQAITLKLTLAALSPRRGSADLSCDKSKIRVTYWWWSCSNTVDSPLTAMSYPCMALSTSSCCRRRSLPCRDQHLCTRLYQHNMRWQAPKGYKSVVHLSPTHQVGNRWLHRRK